MMAYTMRYQEELRKPAEYFSDIKKVAIDKDSLELAETLIKKRTAKFDPSKFTDGYEVALKELVEAKLKHLPIPKDEVVEPKRGQVINLMDALRKSVQSTETPRRLAKKKPSVSVKEAPAREDQGPRAGEIRQADAQVQSPQIRLTACNSRPSHAS